MSNKRLFLDVNVVVDLLVATRALHRPTKELIAYLTLNEYEIIISEDMLTTIFYLVKDKEKVLEFFKVIQKRWSIASFGEELISEAIELSLEQKSDFEDTIQCLCPKANGCEIIITSDKRFFDCGLEILDTDGFMERYI